MGGMFGSNAVSVAVKRFFSRLFRFIKKCYKFCTVNAICQGKVKRKEKDEMITTNEINDFSVLLLF